MDIYEINRELTNLEQVLLANNVDYSNTLNYKTKRNNNEEVKKYLSSLLIFSTLATGLGFVLVKSDNKPKHIVPRIESIHINKDEPTYNLPEEYIPSTTAKTVETTRGTFVLHGANNQDKIANFLYEQGFNDAIVCGIMACMYQESRFDPTTIGDGGCALGIIQWNKERKDGLTIYCNQNGYEPDSLEGQLSYFMYQLDGCDNNKYYIKLRDYLKTVQNDRQGAYNTAFRMTSYVLLPENCEVKACGRGNIAEYMFSSIDEYAVGANRLVNKFESFGKSR